MTEIERHQDLSPVVPSGASTPKQSYSFSIHMSLKGFITVFYRCRQILPPVTIQTWVKSC